MTGRMWPWSEIRCGRTGASVFVHSIKNQLLANRVLYKRIRAELAQPCPDLDRLKEYTDSLSNGNELLISRSEELYRTVKSEIGPAGPRGIGPAGRGHCGAFSQKIPRRSPLSGNWTGPSRY